MWRKLLISVFCLGAVVGLGIPIESVSEAINPDRPAGGSQDTKFSANRIDAFCPLDFPQLLNLPELLSCDTIDYSGGAAAYYWKLTGPYGDSIMGMRFTVQNPACTLQSALVGIYGSGIMGNPGMRVYVYDDDGTGLPGTLRAYADIPSDQLPHAGMYYKPVSLISWNLVFTLGAEFHIGISKTGGAGDTLAFLSDNGSSGLGRAWGYDGSYYHMLEGWGIDVNFLLGASICCAENPFNGAISFAQVNFHFASETVANTRWGWMSVNIPALIAATGIDSGFINAYADCGWIIQNMPIKHYPGLDSEVTYFDLCIPDTQNVTSLSVRLHYSPTPYLTFGDSVRISIPVAEVSCCIVGGVDSLPMIQREVGNPPIHSYMFIPFGPTYGFKKPHSEINVQTATAQCAPMGVANSLEYLRWSYDFMYGLPHEEGHCTDPPGTSLVGELDRLMGRNSVGRDDTLSGGVNEKRMLDGKFKFLKQAGLSKRIKHRHQGCPPSLGAGDYTEPTTGITSEYESVPPESCKVTWDWICQQIQACEDVELAIHYYDRNGKRDGGHVVRIHGCGMVLGIPYLQYLHDRDQTDCDPNDEKGLEWGWTFPHDVDNDGQLNWDGDSLQEVGFALSESPDSIKCGDANGDGKVNILDVIFLINYLYRGGPAPNPPSAGDVNGDGRISILDITRLIGHLYKNGPCP